MSPIRDWPTAAPFFEVVYPRTYEWIAVGRNHQPVYYQETGDRRGRWLLVSRDQDERTYHFDWGEYGSCIYCDNFLRIMDRRHPPADLADQYYRPRFSISRRDMAYWAMTGRDVENIWYLVSPGFDLHSACDETAAAVCFLEGFKPAARHVMYTRNATVKSELLKRMGYEAFLKEADGRVQAADDRGQEIIHTSRSREFNIALLKVVCPTTGNDYLLRIPPDILDVQEAIAWTFGKRPNQWRPEKET